MPAIVPSYRDYQTYLITGATGTFGQAMTRFLLDHTSATIRLLSRNELLQIQMRYAFQDHPRLRFFLGDVRDLARLHVACMDVQCVFHAGALKHIDGGEYDPSEFIATNITGTEHVISACRAMGVEKAVFLSTDKAVQPINLYGATKMVAERLWSRANTYSPDGTAYIAVRYGNVRMSRGSVIQRWREQFARRETPTVTSTSMSRFDISIDEAVRLAWFAAQYGQRGCTLVPHLPAYNILDLLWAVAPHKFEETGAFRVTGIRPGEKLAEMLMTNEEAQTTMLYGCAPNVMTYFCIPPVAPSWQMPPRHEWPLPTDWHHQMYACPMPYASDTWRYRLSVEELRTRVGEGK